MSQYQTDCEGIRKQIDLLQIVHRRIHDNKLASFSLHQPKDAKGLLGWIEVTLLPNGYVAVTGDYDTCVFATFQGDHWRGAISWLASRNPGFYALDKARLGMGREMLQFDSDELHKDLQSLVQQDAINQELADACVSQLKHDEYGEGDHALWIIRDLLYEHGLDGEAMRNLGEVPSYAVVAAIAVLKRLDQLLDAEEEGTKA